MSRMERASDGAIALLALAGLLQALRQVQPDRQHRPGRRRASLATLHRQRVPLRRRQRRGGLRRRSARWRRACAAVATTSAATARDERCRALAMTVLHLERRFVRDAAMAQRGAASGCSAAAARTPSASAATHPDVLARAGRALRRTVSPLGPRVLVQGNPVYLAQTGVVAEVRAVLLAALRSAVLWRQLGGSLLGFLLRRRGWRMRSALHRRLHRMRASQGRLKQRVRGIIAGFGRGVRFPSDPFHSLFREHHHDRLLRHPRPRSTSTASRYTYSSLAKLGERFDLARLPYSMKILLENLLRHEDGVTVTRRHIEAVANWDAEGRTGNRDRLHAGARGAAGLHRRALRGRPGRDARRGRASSAATPAASTR